MQQYDSDELFDVEPLKDKSAFAKKVTCKLCGQILFDSERDSKESIELIFHGLKAHYQIQHDITMGASPCTDPKCIHGS